jgi:hypothetical protein
MFIVEVLMNIHKYATRYIFTFHSFMFIIQNMILHFSLNILDMNRVYSGIGEWFIIYDP